MITLALFITGLLSLLFLEPSTTAFYYKNPDSIMWFVRIFTHMVSHANWGHLLGNYLYGLPYMLYAEYRLKDSRKFLKLFFYSGLAAVFGQRMFDIWSVFPAQAVIGSSGAVFGIIAFALTIAKENKSIRIISLTTLAFHIYNQSKLTWYSMKGLTFGVAFAAHLSGILAGIAMAFILRHHLRRQSQKPKGRQRRNRSRK